MAREQNITTKKVWESVQLYTVSCDKCSKWRLIPTKEKYEQIREKIAEEVFVCETAREWRPNISCNDEPDIKQDESGLVWALDKQCIPQTPSGWQRIIRLRAEGGTKFADIYYVSPSNKRLRSMVELERHLAENPQYQADGVNSSRFSFQSPAPLDADYVSAKRRAVSASSQGTSGLPVAVNNPTSHSAPSENVNTQCGGSISDKAIIEVKAKRVEVDGAGASQAIISRD